MNSHILSLASGLDALAIGDTKGVSPFCLLGPKSAKKINGFTECKTAFLLGAGACTLLHDTVSALESANLTQFEALVSDTACHIEQLLFV